MWFIGVEVEQETSAPPPKKILDPPLCHVKANLIKFKIRNSICVTLQFTAVCFLQNLFIRLTSDPKN